MRARQTDGRTDGGANTPQTRSRPRTKNRMIRLVKRTRDGVASRTHNTTRVIIIIITLIFYPKTSLRSLRRRRVNCRKRVKYDRTDRIAPFVIKNASTRHCSIPTIKWRQRIYHRFGLFWAIGEDCKRVGEGVANAVVSSPSAVTTWSHGLAVCWDTFIGFGGHRRVGPLELCVINTRTNARTPLLLRLRCTREDFFSFNLVE